MTRSRSPAEGSRDREDGGQRPWLATALRAGGTVALAGFLLHRLDLGGLGSRLGRLDARWTTVAFTVVLVAVVVSAWKWGLILRGRGHAIPFRKLLGHYYVGLFFNNVLPTTVGGDAVRAWATTRETGEVPEAVGSVVSERLLAGVALGVTALLGLPFVGASPRLVAGVLGFLAVDLVLVGLFLVPRFAERVVTSVLPARRSGARAVVSRTVNAVRATLANPGLAGRVVALSVLFQVLVAAVNAALFAALGVPVGLARCVVFTPMVFTVTMLPISFSGLGVREAAYAYFFGLGGTPPADGVAASLLFFVVVGLSSLPGAVLFALGRRAPVTLAPEHTS